VSPVTPEELKKDRNLALIKEVLGKEYMSLVAKSLTMEEDLLTTADSAHPVQTTLKIKENDRGRIRTLKAQGVGIVDSVFQGLKEYYGTEYESLGKINLSSFTVTANNLKAGPSPEGSTAPVEVVLEFQNAYNKCVPFREKSYSLSSSVVAALISACEYYINAELAFRKLRGLIDDSRLRSRGDLEQAYISKIVNIVGVSSYEDLF